MTEAHQQ